MKKDVSILAIASFVLALLPLCPMIILMIIPPELIGGPWHGDGPLIFMELLFMGTFLSSAMSIFFAMMVLFNKKKTKGRKLAIAGLCIDLLIVGYLILLFFG